VLQSAFVPGSRLNSTSTPRDRTCLSHILAYPWDPIGITATTELPAHRRGTLHILKPDAPSVQQLVDELLLEIDLRATESVVESTIQLPARASSHAASRHPAHSERIWRGKGSIADTHPDRHQQLQLYTDTRIHKAYDEGVFGFPCSRPWAAGTCRPLWSSRTGPQPEPVRRHGPLGAIVCTAATNARPGPRSRGL
jgi:hypothetical protein